MLVGKQFPVKEGLRVVMAPGLPDKGTGTIKTLVDGGARVSVKWDDSGVEETISTGDGGNYDLAAATRVQDTPLTPSVASTSVGYDRGQSASINYDTRGLPASTGYAESNTSGFGAGGVGTPAGYRDALQTSVGYTSILEEPPARTPGQASVASSAAYRSAASPAAPALLASQRSALATSQTSLFTSQRQQSHATNGYPEGSFHNTLNRSVQGSTANAYTAEAGSFHNTLNRSTQGSTANGYAAEAGSFRNTINRSTQGSVRQGTASRLSGESAGAASVGGGSEFLHKQLLAQEVVKLRKELDELRTAKARRSTDARAAASNRAAGADAARSEMMARLRGDMERLERERDDAVTQATQQKGALAQEVKALREELDDSKRKSEARAEQLEAESILSTPVGQALAQRREFEERFTHALRDLRAQLESSTIKALSMSSDAPVGIRSLLHHSNARIDGALEDATRIPVEERLHIECLRIVIENGKIRKALNEYAQGLLDNALVKEGFQPRINTQGTLFTTNLGGGNFFSSLFV